MELKIITGLSGAGKSTIVNKLEDLGYYCIDNLPPTLLEKFLELIVASGTDTQKIALVIDIRGRAFFNGLSETLNKLKKTYTNCEIIFLEASVQSLVKRYQETRRAHPLNNGENDDLIDGIHTEIEMTRFLRDMADRIIDTTDMRRRDLDALIVKAFSEKEYSKAIEVEFSSFGFKNGLPLHADMVFDVRFVDNPYYEKDLKHLTGEDELVYSFVFFKQIANDYYDKIFSLLKLALGEYAKEGRSHLTIAVGCTGGKHRSVAYAKRLSEEFKLLGYKTELKHRDIAL